MIVGVYNFESNNDHAFRWSVILKDAKRLPNSLLYSTCFQPFSWTIPEWALLPRLIKQKEGIRHSITDNFRLNDIPTHATDESVINFLFTIIWLAGSSRSNWKKEIQLPFQCKNSLWTLRDGVVWEANDPFRGYPCRWRCPGATSCQRWFGGSQVSLETPTESCDHRWCYCSSYFCYRCSFSDWKVRPRLLKRRQQPMWVVILIFFNAVLWHLLCIEQWFYLQWAVTAEVSIQSKITSSNWARKHVSHTFPLLG